MRKQGYDKKSDEGKRRIETCRKEILYLWLGLSMVAGQSSFARVNQVLHAGFWHEKGRVLACVLCWYKDLMDEFWESDRMRRRLILVKLSELGVRPLL